MDYMLEIIIIIQPPLTHSAVSQHSYDPGGDAIITYTLYYTTTYYHPRTNTNALKC